jgi:4-hydroxy-tetrahydrodipicolinate reductase
LSFFTGITEIMSAAKLRLVVHGAAGRMGRRVIALAREDDTIALVGGVEHEGHPLLGNDLGGLAGGSALDLALAAQWPGAVDAVIDFSLPSAVDSCLQHCLATGTPLVVATTGLDCKQQDSLRLAGQRIAVCWAPSMSLAVNLTMRLAQQVAAALKDVAGGVDVEIIERHHRYKEDAPSGTALKFGELIAEQLQRGGGEVRHLHGRQGKTGQRTAGEIGYHAVRAGDNPGEHTIVFGMLGEKLELNVAASSRDCYASGAIAAAKWLQGQSAGLYDMFDVLGMSQSAPGHKFVP